MNAPIPIEGSARARFGPVWVLAHANAIPTRWRDRGTPLVLVPLLPEEATAILRNGSVHPAVPPEDEELARMMARGWTSVRIARTVGVSTRTAQRHISALNRRIGARTREEAIAILAAQGFASDRASATP